MEEKESTVSGSMSDSGSDSPSPVTSYAAAAAALGEMTPPETPFGYNMTNISAAGPGLVTPFPGSMTSSPAGINSGDTSGKKKRGRPRKYDSEGNLIVRTVEPKKTKASGYASGDWNLLASLGGVFARTAVDDFTPLILTVNTGEDLAGKILSLTEKGPRGICVLSATGAVSNVTFRQPGSAGGFLTYEGRFEILSLTGLFVITELGGFRNKTGGLSISLAGPDGRVIGGVVAGVLTASNPIQVVIGSFLTFDAAKPQKRKYKSRPVNAPALASALSNADAAAACTRQASQTKPEDESVVFGGQHQSQMAEEAAWNGSEAGPNCVILPEANISAPSEHDLSDIS